METTKLTKVGILGYGEVGQAMASFYKEPVQIQDKLRKWSFTEPLDILHVCIPFSRDFIRTVSKVMSEFCPLGLTIIHSTVPVGTTEALAKVAGLRFVVHSPVRGVHPNLEEGISTFEKYIGADFVGAGRLAAEHFAEIGIKPEVVYRSRTTELMKLLDTTYYGLVIAFHAYAAKLCEQEDLPFDTVMTHANNTYNLGYTRLGKHSVIRPILYPPKEGKIGGHCVIPNAQLLLEQFGDDELLQTILRHK